MKYPIVKEWLARGGALLTASGMHKLNGLFNYLHVGWWMRQNSFDTSRQFSTREELYRTITSQVTEPATYLEFGVFEGASLRIWSSLLRHPDSTLDGFDSFEGLPERWRLAADKSTFDVGGALPRIDDGRVRLFKGWFSETLPPYLTSFAPKPAMILHLDADLYSSTAYILKELTPFLRPGVILIFDEFFDRDHELRAFEEFLTTTQLQMDCIGVTRTFTQAAFRIRELRPSA